MRALVTGLSGQDGSYLADALLADGWEVHGTVRDQARLGCADHLQGQVQVHQGELLEPGFLRAVVERVRPQRLYHLASPTFVPDSWADPAGTLAAVAGASAEVLEAARDCPEEVRVLLASSREIFGNTPHSPQSEDTPRVPTSPYGVAKLAAHGLAGVMRTHYGMHVSSAILFNHESPRRPLHFVTRKITRAAAAIKLGVEDELVLGDLGAVRDWSAAWDVMAGCRLMLEAEEPDDYVLASGTARTVGDFVQAAFAHAGVNPEGRVRVDQDFVRVREQADPVGDPGKARRRLGWQAQSSFTELVGAMVDRDLQDLKDLQERGPRA